MPPVRPDAVKSAALLREARLRAGLSQVALAELSGKDRVQIGRYEAGAVAPSLDTLIELIRACGFDLPLELVPFSEPAQTTMPELLRLSPERRLERMLTRLGASKAR
jgi:transcriptional regulator with XRE-family HTH domain